MSDLSAPVPAIEPERLADLRRRAASRLAGAAAAKGTTASAADALTVLHALASSPETASDALALLHELQVHQVELDLQAQELRDSLAEVESALRRQIERHDLQPVGCFTVDARLVVLELNLTGAEMLGVGRDDAIGQPLGAFFSPDGEHRFRSLVSSVDAGSQHPSCLLRLRPKGGPEQTVLASVGKDRAAGRYLAALATAGDERDPSAH